MPLPLTGSLGSGISTLGILALGGPPAYPSAASTWTRTLPTKALPFIAHLYQNNGITFIKSLGPLLTRPVINIKATNGGYDRVMLDLPTRDTSLVQGSVVKLTEQGGDGSVIAAGIVNSLPDTISSTGTSHQVELTPFGFELADVYVQNNYTVPTDVAQMVRDAVAATLHCHCDQTSVPANVGVTAVMDFRNRPAMDVINTCRTLAGYTWFWHVGPTGRVWFQSMGSVPLTAKLGVDYSVRFDNGGDISQLKNDVLVLGGLRPDGTAASGQYTGSDISTYGKKSLNPPLSFPLALHQPTLDAIANGVGTVLDRVWRREELTLLPTFGSRVNPEQPGGAILRYFEPAVLPLPESGTGTGGYIGPHIVQDISLDGASQKVVAGDAPVTDIHDFDNLIKDILSRQSIVPFLTPGPMAPLVNPRIIFTDSNGVTRAETGALLARGISPAHTGIRINDATGLPIADSLGLIGVIADVQTSNSSGTFTTVTPTLLTGSGITVVMARPGKILFSVTVEGVATAGGNNGVLDVFGDGISITNGFIQWGAGGPTVTSSMTMIVSLTAGSHTLDLRGYLTGVGGSFLAVGAFLQIYPIGS